MWNRKAVVSGLAIAAVAFVSACSDAPPTQPTAQIEETPHFSQQALFGSPRQVGSQSLRSLDAEFARLAGEIPGFGGLFFDEAGTLNVVMAGEQQMVSSAQLASALGSRLQAVGLDAALAQGLIVRQGRYDFAQLHAWHQRLLPLFHLVPGVVFTDADERANRLRIGIEAQVSTAALEQAISSLGIPLEAVSVVAAEPVVIPQAILPMSDHTLSDQVRPVAAGLQIAYQRPGVEGFFVCTMGFVIRAEDVPPPHPSIQNQGFLIGHAGACTPELGTVDYARYWQPSPLLPNSFIGWEAFDPDFHRAGGNCDPTRDRCRWSNVAGLVFAVEVSVDFGYIYRTLFPGTVVEGAAEPGSVEIDPENPRFRIVDEAAFPFDGLTLHKVGRSAGWTAGTVDATCFNISVGGQPELTVMICQDRFASLFLAGDPGAPVFERLGSGADDQVRAHGIAWGIQTIDGLPRTVFSALSNIRLDIPGGWTTH